MATEKKYKNFWSFYPYYLTEHSDLTNRTLHFIGTAGLLGILVAAIILQKWWMLALIPVCGYGFAWFGHPLYSLGSDFVMFWHMLTGQIGKKLEEAKKTIA